jgi:hypothetical protein
MSAMYKQILSELSLTDRYPFTFCYQNAQDVRTRARCLVWSFDRRVSLWNPFLYPYQQANMARRRHKRETNNDLQQLGNALLEIVKRTKGKSLMRNENHLRKFARFKEILQMEHDLKQHNSSATRILSPNFLSLMPHNRSEAFLSPSVLSLNENSSK